jgi:nucleoid-associated protein YgaU
MTRETKIGLLVGLAFIIVIGILLSDHMTSTTEPPKAPLSVAGNNVRESVMSPGAAPAVAAVGTPGVVAPNQTVLTGADIAAPQPAAPQLIQIGPGQPQAQSQSPIVVQQAPIQQASLQQIPVQVSPGVPQPAQPPVTIADAPVIVTPPSQRQAAAHPLQQTAGRLGEEIVGVGEPSNAPPQPTGPTPVPMAPLREYKAQADDTLSKLAGRFLGGNTKANRDAIVRVNPTLQQNPDKIVAGRTYVIPPTPGGDTTAAVPAPAPPVARTPAAQAVASARQPAPETGNFQWYTVKENENLWKIAAEQLGSGNAWTQIRDLNPDVLKGEDRLKANMRIRIPNKPVASAH